MANRCSLYKADLRDNNMRTRIKGVTEWSYNIPICAKILVSQQSSLTKSILYICDGNVAIQGNYRLGIDKLYSFFDRLLELDIVDRYELEEKVKKIKEVFANNGQETREVFVLEPLEVISMLGNDEILETQKLYNDEITNIDAYINTAINEMQTLKMENKTEEIWEMLGIDDFTVFPYAEFVTDRGEYQNDDGFDESFVVDMSVENGNSAVKGKHKKKIANILAAIRKLNLK